MATAVSRAETYFESRIVNLAFMIQYSSCDTARILNQKSKCKTDFGVTMPLINYHTMSKQNQKRKNIA